MPQDAGSLNEDLRCSFPSTTLGIEHGTLNSGGEKRSAWPRGFSRWVLKKIMFYPYHTCL